ncbi:Formin-binding protein 1 [Homalodisca vitripennis]|nr:Formin-binding protein 1 [Homalodisca vitripennis]
MTNVGLPYYRYSPCKAFKSAMQELSDLAGQHEVIAENLQQDVIREVTILVKDMKDERKKPNHSSPALYFPSGNKQSPIGIRRCYDRVQLASEDVMIESNWHQKIPTGIRRCYDRVQLASEDVMIESYWHQKIPTGIRRCYDRVLLASEDVMIESNWHQKIPTGIRRCYDRVQLASEDVMKVGFSTFFGSTIIPCASASE